MGLREFALGKGTIAYRGESVEYWQAKTSRLPRGRTIITMVILAAGLLLTGVMVSPWGPHRHQASVLQVTPTADGGSRVVMSVSGAGAPLTATIGRTVAIPLVGSTIPVVTLGAGRVLIGTDLWFTCWGVVAVLLGTAFGRLLWRAHKRGVRTVFR